MASNASISERLRFMEAKTQSPVEAAEGISRDVLSRYIEESRNDYYAWQLIQFFAQHPYMRFNRLAVVHALSQDNRRSFIMEALEGLIEEGIVKVTHEGCSVVYSLSDNMRLLVLKLTRSS